MNTCTIDATAFLEALLGMPSTETLATAFWFSLSTPLTGYLVAYAVGILVNFWNK